jgi:hypothetical protein
LQTTKSAAFFLASLSVALCVGLFYPFAALALLAAALDHLSTIRQHVGQINPPSGEAGTLFAAAATSRLNLASILLPAMATS